MESIVQLFTQFQNQTQNRVGFRVHGSFVPLDLRDIPQGRTRKVKLSRKILRCCWERHHSEWKIGVLVDGVFTGIELDPVEVLDYVRFVFLHRENEDGEDVFCIDGVPENCSDYLLRLRFVGCMRDAFWNKRETVKMAQADSKYYSRPFASPVGKRHNKEDKATTDTKTLIWEPAINIASSDSSPRSSFSTTNSDEASEVSSERGKEAADWRKETNPLVKNKSSNNLKAYARKSELNQGPSPVQRPEVRRPAFSPRQDLYARESRFTGSETSPDRAFSRGSGVTYGGIQRQMERIIHHHHHHDSPLISHVPMPVFLFLLAFSVILFVRVLFGR